MKGRYCSFIHFTCLIFMIQKNVTAWSTCSKETMNGWFGELQHVGLDCWNRWFTQSTYANTTPTPRQSTKLMWNKTQFVTFKAFILQWMKSFYINRDSKITCSKWKYFYSDHCVDILFLIMCVCKLNRSVIIPQNCIMSINKDIFW